MQGGYVPKYNVVVSKIYIEKCRKIDIEVL